DGTIFRREGDIPTKTRLTEETSLGPIRFHYKSFFQINIPIADALTAKVMEIIEKTQPAAVIDLYCGVGLFALAAGKAGVPAVLGIDRNKTAVRDARKNARNLDLPGVRFEMMNARDGLEFALPPVKPEETVLIVDPPRAGLGRDLISLITRYKPGTIIYISCAPDTLARDISRLANAEYRIESTQIFDMFPRTPYFESITIFT
ncbi:MAG: methyltransferase domain-containing protein, partial [Candidatus Auribacterota bacterium]|nr:methyltransferase domain-containing protein [Candidatus Auribacterota bacterium]